MRATLTVARAELRGLFRSPTALLFLLSFLGANLFYVFGWQRFLARGLADVRPMFDGLPLLLVFLVAAVTMRAWAEERRGGTLEVLLTLPVPTASLVLGKYLAGLALVAIALALTTPLPLSVSLLGPLDWGPVIGGYVAALGLGSAYLALGLWVSAQTDNQVVALLVTLLAGTLAWLVGSDAVVALWPASIAQVLEALGTGARFDSIERGVLDLRDVAYYAALTVAFLAFNGIVLERQRLDRDGARGRRRSRSLMALGGLVAANAALLVAWLSPVTAARFDLTENQDFTLSPVTEQVVADLQEPVRVRALLSQRTHEALLPLIPTLTDLLHELEVAGEGKVFVEVLDPSDDEALEVELVEQFGLRPVPFAVADRHSQAVVNAWFHVLLESGSAHEVLSFEDLIDVRFDGTGPDVILRNPEYDLARALRKVGQETQSADVLLASLPEGSTLTAYVTENALPDGFDGTAEAFREVGDELAERSGGRLAFDIVDPSGDDELQARLFEDLGVQALAADLLGTQRFYLHLVLQAGDGVEVLYPRADATPGEVRQSMDAALMRVVPGQRKTVALVTETPQAPQGMPPGYPTPRADYQGLRRVLEERFDVVATDLTDGRVPDTADVVMVAKPGELDDAQRYALDQYLMQGGAVVALAADRDLDAARSLATTEAPDDLKELLQGWGACVGDGLVMATRNAAFPVPVEQTMGGVRLRRVEMMPYPFFPDVRPDAMAQGHPATAGIAAMSVPWASPVSACDGLTEELEATELVWAEGAVDTTGKVQPDPTSMDPSGFRWPSGAPTRQPLALALTGRFPSALAEGTEPPEGMAPPLTEAVAEGRLLVVGSTEIASDIMLNLASQTGSEVHRGNLQLVQNAIDWAVEDTALLGIRSGGAFARVLVPLERSEARAIELGTAGVTGTLALVVLGVARLRRRSIELPLAEVS